MSALERKRFYRGAGGVLRWGLGTVAGAALLGAWLFKCDDAGCGLRDLSVGDAPSIAAASMFSGGGSAEPALSGDGGAAAAALAAQLDIERGQIAKLTAALETANQERARADANAAAARKAVEEAQGAGDGGA